MSQVAPQSTAAAAPAVLRCRRCHQPMERGRQVFCSDACITMADNEATRLASQAALLRRDVDQEAAAIEAEIARFAAERRRVLSERRYRLEQLDAALAPLTANIDAAKQAGEVRFALDIDNPTVHGWQ